MSSTAQSFTHAVVIRTLLGLSLTMFALLVHAGSMVRADDGPTLRELDPWARFPAGSWKTVRTVTEMLDSKERVSNTTVTETTTTVAKVNADRVSLRIDVSVEVGGKRFRTETQTIEHGFLGERPQQTAKSRPANASNVKIAGQEIAVDVHEVSIDGDQKTFKRLFISPKVCPYVLRREVHSGDPKQPASLQVTTSDVFEIDQSLKVGGQIKTVSRERAIDRTSTGETETIDTVACDVPGGIVHRSQKERDINKRVIRQSEVEVVEYYVARDDDRVAETRRQRLFGRDRRGR